MFPANFRPVEPPSELEPELEPEPEPEPEPEVAPESESVPGADPELDAPESVPRLPPEPLLVAFPLLLPELLPLREPLLLVLPVLPSELPPLALELVPPVAASSLDPPSSSPNQFTVELDSHPRPAARNAATPTIARRIVRRDFKVNSSRGPFGPSDSKRKMPKEDFNPMEASVRLLQGAGTHAGRRHARPGAGPRSGDRPNGLRRPCSSASIATSMSPHANPCYARLLQITALAGVACSPAPTPRNDFEGTWSCGVDEINLAEGGAQMFTGSFGFTAGSDGTLASTEEDDAGILRCTIQYAQDGSTATVSGGQTCEVGGASYAISGSASVISTSLDFNVSYTTGSGSVVEGIIVGMCSK